MKTSEQELIDYLHEQFPATIGHLSLAEKIHNVWRQGMTDAIREAEIIGLSGDELRNGSRLDSVACWWKKVETTILEARDKVKI